MSAMRLRVRVAAAVAVTCIAIVAALGLTLLAASQRLEDNLVSQIVNEEMTYLVREYMRNPQVVVYEPSPNVQYYIVRSPADRALVPQNLRTLKQGQYTLGSGTASQFVVVRDVGSVHFIVAYDSGQHKGREQQFKQLLLIAIATVIVIAAGVGYWIAGLVTRQITGLAERVAGLDPVAPRAPLAALGQDPEVAALAQAFDDYQQRIRTLIEREQEFTGNASHELRTPLTAIRTSCELLEADASLPEKARNRIAAISAAAERMTGQIETLLFLARAQAVGEQEPVNIAEAVNDVVDPLRDEINRKGLQFDNAVDAGAQITVNPHALHLVLANLIRNAVQYTDAGRIRIDWQAPTLTVSDTGLGVPEALRERLFDRHFRGTDSSDGLGLGLAIVKRACEHCGWAIRIDSPAEGGSTFALTLG
ncbi:MAG: HAMP domain-containing histidine kinase [Burkholderiales bacterium]|nr:HAMP domain-containing histidine kinase [Burkholderiales bacterium]